MLPKDSLLEYHMHVLELNIFPGDELEYIRQVEGLIVRMCCGVSLLFHFDVLCILCSIPDWILTD